MNDRLGFVGIVIEDHASVAKVNEILSQFAPCIRGRLGLPDAQSGVSVITLVVLIDSDRLGAMTGRLGKLRGVKVKSALTSAVTKQTEGE